MKKLLSFVAAATFVLALSSCEKCKDCTPVVLGVEAGDTEELCGDDLDAAEKAYSSLLDSGMKCE